jgi:NAD(P)-dependent dehydrogenase (short-subunit alcohol dehydrogenase family)
MKALDGKVAFITGGASGIGLGLAKVFGAQGVKLMLADVRQEALDAALNELQAMDIVAQGLVVDVADRQAMRAAAAATVAAYGKVHLLFNNAGISFFGPMDQAMDSDWDWMLGVNLQGVINGVQAFLPHLKAHGEGGHIVNTASMAGLLVGPGMGLYSASKFAVVGLSNSLRLDLAPHGIGVSVLCPGFVRSNIHEAGKLRPARYAETGYHISEADQARLDQVLSVGMAPTEVAEAVLPAVLANREWIFPHAEFRQELRELFDRMLAALPEREPDPGRTRIEDMRRARRAAAAEVADRLGR